MKECENIKWLSLILGVFVYTLSCHLSINALLEIVGSVVFAFSTWQQTFDFGDSYFFHCSIYPLRAILFPTSNF